MAEELKIQKIEYYRLIRPPTLKQFLHRKAVSQAMQQVKGELGVGIDPNTGKPAPLSAIKAKEILKGLRAEELAGLHPDWVEDYKRQYGTGN